MDRGKILGALYSKKSPIQKKTLASIEHCPKFLEYTLQYFFCSQM